VITLGDGNVVNAQFTDLHSALEELKAVISSCDKLDDGEKLNLAVDIESIKDQLAKPEPNKAIIGQLWEGLEKIAVVSGVAEAYHKVEPYIQALLT
jgi:hypothetical protein